MPMVLVHLSLIHICNMLSSHLLGSNIENINQEKLSNISFGLQNNMDSHNTNMGPISSDDSSNVGECPSDKVDQSDLKDITSTMIGTFYTSPSPDEPVFAKVGDKIKKGQVVCIIESMKLMNEVKSCFDCEIVEVLVGDQEVVEFGQALFRVRAVSYTHLDVYKRQVFSLFLCGIIG